MGKAPLLRGVMAPTPGAALLLARAGRTQPVVDPAQLPAALASVPLALMDLDDPEVSPLYSGRLQLALIGKEPGFYGSSTYYGGKNVLAWASFSVTR